MSSINLLGNYLAVEPVESTMEGTYVNGLMMPVGSEPYSRGVVKIVSKDASYIPLGSTIIYHKGKGFDYNLNGVQLKIIESFDVIGIENEKE